MADDIAKKIGAKLTLGDLDLLEKEETETQDFETYATYWLEDYIKPLRRESTYERYRDILKRHVFPEIGKRPIGEIKRAELRNLLLRKRKAKYSRSMICLIRDVISGPMGYAVDEEIITGNPVQASLNGSNWKGTKGLPLNP